MNVARPACGSTTAAGDLGFFRDIVDRASAVIAAAGDSPSLEEIRARARCVLAFDIASQYSAVAELDRTWVSDGLRFEELGWDVGYGPQTRATVVRPDTDEQLPGVLALHCHGHFKFHGSQKLVDGPDGPADGVAAVRAEFYGGRALAMELARRGNVVLCHDTFMWGSRGFALATMAQALRRTDIDREDTSWDTYNRLAVDHEHVVSKYCNALGFSLAAVVSHEDRVALSVLVSRQDVLPVGAGVVGFSGGGQRASYLAATADAVSATVVVGAMSTRSQLLDHHVTPHTWMIFPPQLPWLGEWPDFAASGAPRPLMAIFGRNDEMYTLRGMLGADAHLRRRYASVGASDQYVGLFYDAGHEFSIEMQERAFDWLDQKLKGPAGTGRFA